MLSTRCDDQDLAISIDDTVGEPPCQAPSGSLSTGAMLPAYDQCNRALENFCQKFIAETGSLAIVIFCCLV